MLDLVLQFLPFAVSAAVTPGPNNVMVTASTANFGFRRTLPCMAGIALGFPVMVLAIGLGLGAAFERYPAVHQAMQWLGAAYLLFLAWRIATAAPAGETEARAPGRPLTFLQAALFQWVNVKAWIIAVGAVSTYTTVGGSPLVETPLIAAVFGLVAAPSIALWAGFGLGVRHVLRSPRAFRVFNVAMAVLLVASLVPLVA